MFFRNFSKLVSTTFLIQGISVLLYPLITRRWDPVAFGQFSFLISLGSIVSIFSTGQYHVGAMVESDRAISDELVEAAKFINLITTLLVLLVVILIAPEAHWYILPFFVFTFTSYEIFRVTAIRDQQINTLASGQIISRVGANLLKLIPGPTFVLGLSEILGSLGGVLFLSKGNVRKIFIFKIPRAEILQKYKKYPLFYTVNLGTQSLTYELPALLLGLQHNNFMVGIYGICQRLMIQPMTTVSNNIFTAIFSMPLTVEERLKKSLKLALLATAIGISLKISFDLFGDYFLLKFLGHKWEDGKEMFSIFSFVLVTKTLSSMALANYISTYRLEKSTVIRLVQIIFILLAYYFTGSDNLTFFKIFVGIDMFFDLFAFVISLKKSQV